MNYSFQTPCSFGSQKDHTAIGGLLALERGYTETAAEKHNFSPLHFLFLFLAVTSRRRKRVMVKEIHFFFLSCFLLPPHLFRLLLLAHSPQMCGWARDYCSNAFLIYKCKSRDFILGLWDERRAKHKPEGLTDIVKRMVLFSLHVAGPPPSHCSSLSSPLNVLDTRSTV